MKIIDTHIHTIFRPTHFFENYRLMGVESVVSVAFYPIKPRNSETLEDLFRWISEHEPLRLQSIDISCYCGLGIHPRAIPSNLDPKIFQLIEKSIQLPSVVCLAEIGLEKGNKEEVEVLEKQLEIVSRNKDYPVILHTPKKNKREITKKLLEICDSLRISVGIVDHVSLENIDLVFDTKLHMGLTVQRGKLTIENFLAIIKDYQEQTNRFIINSDLGIDPANKFGVPQAVQRMVKEGIDMRIIEKIAFLNAKKLFRLR